MPIFQFGQVADDGTIANPGSAGWTSDRVPGGTTGMYQVIFNEAFDVIPVVIVSCHGDDNNTIATMEIMRDYFVVHSKQVGGHFDDSAFGFLAVANDAG